ncbi:MAG: flagellar export protein FliJ [Herminiimonas sp.]|nr:flagellar export protein FliJ [Herminiimonas sp.]
MAHPSALETLIELATTATDEAAKRLGRATRAAEEARGKLVMLQQYNEDYAARFQASMKVGLTPMGYRNFQSFMDKLDTAIAGQQKVVNDADQRILTERSAWQESERKRISYDTLVTRARNAEQLKETKRDQKATDEQAARILLYKR